jgi:hypothetical protein
MEQKKVIEMDKVNLWYNKGTGTEVHAIKDAHFLLNKVSM